MHAVRAWTYSLHQFLQTIPKYTLKDILKASHLANLLVFFI